MTDRITVTIARSTAKAHLVEANGRQGWIQARWLREDGTVKASTFEKAVGEFEARQAGKQARAELEASWFALPIARETDRGVATTVVVEFAGGESERLVWFPKSQCRAGAEGEFEAPFWLVKAKQEEAVEGHRPSGRYEAHRAAKGETAFLRTSLFAKPVSA